MLMKAVGKIKLELALKDFNLKSASIININNPINEDILKNKNSNNNYIKIIKRLIRKILIIV